MDRQLILLLLVIVHLGAAGLHGYSHAIVPVQLSTTLNAMVLLTVFIGPTLGAILDRRNHELGIAIFTVSMIGAMLISGVFHFLIENPDHVSTVPATQAGHLFELSALAVLFTPLIGAAYGARCWHAGQS